MTMKDIFSIGKKYTPISFVLSVTCVFVSCLTVWNHNIWELLAYWSNPQYPWQYLSGAFVHGCLIFSESPVWFVWIHLFLNLLMILPLGILLEKILGSAKLMELFVFSWLICSVVYQILLWDQHIPASGISAIGYSFWPGTVYVLLKIFKENRNAFFHLPSNYFYITILSLMVIMLIPAITGMVSFELHISGVIVGLIFALRNKKTIDLFFDKQTAYVPSKVNFVILIWLIPIGILLIVGLYLLEIIKI